MLEQINLDNIQQTTLLAKAIKYFISIENDIIHDDILMHIREKNPYFIDYMKQSLKILKKINNNYESKENIILNSLTKIRVINKKFNNIIQDINNICNKNAYLVYTFLGDNKNESINNKNFLNLKNILEKQNEKQEKIVLGIHDENNNLILINEFLEEKQNQIKNNMQILKQNIFSYLFENNNDINESPRKLINNFFENTLEDLNKIIDNLYIKEDLKHTVNPKIRKILMNVIKDSHMQILKAEQLANNIKKVTI